MDKMTPATCSPRRGSRWWLSTDATIVTAGEGELQLREVLHKEGHERKELKHEIKAEIEPMWELTERWAR
jgi:glucosamine 6-phosphate synthetase-like amidotransferase/phosphosugar isomerase protein